MPAYTDSSFIITHAVSNTSFSIMPAVSQMTFYSHAPPPHPLSPHNTQMSFFSLYAYFLFASIHTIIKAINGRPTLMDLSPRFLNCTFWLLYERMHIRHLGFMWILQILK
jgi:hypothetical protein